MLTAGIDEAGRGPLAGPVVAAAVVFKDTNVAGLDDSKVLSDPRRRALYATITEQAADWAVGVAASSEIDALNIHHATLLAMRRAVEGLARTPDLALIDGKFCPALACPARAIVGGDGSVASISAASIIAKVWRDDLMLDLDNTFPDYGFARHKGYPTREHLGALQRFGVTPEHRRSFAPVRRCLAQATER